MPWKTGSWLEARRKSSCPPAVEQQPSFNLSFFCGTTFFMGHFQAVSGCHCFSVYCLINSQCHSCFVSKLVLSCETDFHLVSGRCYCFGLLSVCDAFLMRPAVLGFINSLPLSCSKFFLTPCTFLCQIHCSLIQPTFKSTHCCIFKSFRQSFRYIFCDRNT